MTVNRRARKSKWAYIPVGLSVLTQWVKDVAGPTPHHRCIRRTVFALCGQDEWPLTCDDAE